MMQPSTRSTQPHPAVAIPPKDPPHAPHERVHKIPRRIRRIRGNKTYKKLEVRSKQTRHRKQLTKLIQESIVGCFYPDISTLNGGKQMY